MNPFTGPYAKFYTAIVGAAVQLLSVWVPHNQVATVVLAILTALGVYVVPNNP